MLVFSLKKITKNSLIAITGCAVVLFFASAFFSDSLPASTTGNQEDFIKWVDFNATYSALNDTMKADIASNGKNSWIDLLAYLAAKNGNNFKGYKQKDLQTLLEQLEAASMEELTKDLNYFDYYHEVFSAVLGNFIGEYAIEVDDPEFPDEKIWETRYGLKVFSPIAQNYWYSDYDDFGNSRSYGYKRRHTGHDLFGSIGTPVVAIEGGTVESLGWNQYGGWRIGIRSFDKKRYYYYAHLRKDHPYSAIMKEGATIHAGDVIGYLGMTGYSTTENVNNINTPHLHMGIQLIFDESQKEGNTEIWIDCYNILKILEKNKSAVYKDDQTNEYYRKYNIYDR